MLINPQPNEKVVLHAHLLLKRRDSASEQAGQLRTYCEEREAQNIHNSHLRNDSYPQVWMLHWQRQNIS
jgi:hypothetical protein